MQSFLLAMALYPDVQKRAQAELDTVIGNDKFPEFIDRPSLSYINAVIKELTRWSLIVPLGKPASHPVGYQY